MNAFLAQAPVAWYVARAAGLVAFGLLTLSVWLGLGMSTRLLGPKRQKSLFGWHQTLAWTGLSMLALHAGALLFDPTLHFGLASVLAPFASRMAPGRRRSRRHRRLAHARARARPSGCGSESASAAGAGCTTRASPPSSSRSGTPSPQAPISRASAARCSSAIAAGPVIWLGLTRILLPRPGRPVRPAIQAEA